MNDIKKLTNDIFADLQRLIDETPDKTQAPEEPRPDLKRHIWTSTNIPKRYREEWERPGDSKWNEQFSKVVERCKSGGIVAMIGPRGHGKTRFAAEAVRDVCPNASRYTTAMQLFLRVRSSYAKTAEETEERIVQDLSKCPLLVIDETQERGNTEWEDRMLTHIIDARYGGILPTIIIANLTKGELVKALGDSITSRLMETGGIMEVNDTSHRIQE